MQRIFVLQENGLVVIEKFNMTHTQALYIVLYCISSNELFIVLKD